MKQRIFWKQLIMMLLTLITILTPTIVRAESNYQLVIQDNDNPVTNISYTLWLMEDVSYIDQEASLNQASLAELNSLFPTSFQTIPTNTQGYTEISLPQGIYYARATQNGELTVNIQPFFVELLSNNQRINPKSHQDFGSLKIIKQDQAGNVLQGVRFELYYQDGITPIYIKDGKVNSDGEGSTQLQTNEKGQIVIDQLLPGQYLLKETSPIAGYRPLEELIDITINSQQTTELVVYNEAFQLGGYHFRKVDAENQTFGLEGAVFEVQQLVDNRYQTYSVAEKSYTVTSGEDGYFTVQDLPYGTYQLIEIKAPILDGVLYQVSSQPIPFEITAESFYQGSEIVILNHRELIPGRRLPSTGEASSWIWSICALLILGIGLLLLRKKGK